MPSKFFAGFQKTAIVGAVAGRVAKTIGKGLIRASGGKFNAAMNVLGVASDAQNISDKIKSTYVR